MKNSGTYQCYSRKAINQNPVFIEPHRHSERPFIRKLINKVDGWANTYNFRFILAKARRSGIIKRAPVKERIDAINALLPAMCFHYDALMNRVNASVATLASECGLTTKRAHETHINTAITRATRAIIYLKKIGLVNYFSKKCKITGGYFPSDISFTPLFFEMIDISEAAVQAEIESKQAWINKKRAKAGMRKLYGQELVAELWNEMRDKFIAYRIARKARGEKLARALKDAQRTRKEIQEKVRLQLQKEIIDQRFPADLMQVRAEIERRVNERMKLSRSKAIRIEPSAA